MRDLPTERLIISPADELLTAPRWSPDGRYVFFASGTALVLGWELASGGQAILHTGHDDQVIDLAWSPGGESLATLSSYALYLLDGCSPKAREASTAEQAVEFTGFSWSPDGRSIALTEYPVASCEQDDQLDEGERGGSSFSPWPGGTVRVLEMATGRECTRRENVGGPVTWVVEGKLVVPARETSTVHIWNPRAVRVRRANGRHHGRIVALAGAPPGSPLGSCIASAGEEGTLRVWQPVSGQEFFTSVVEPGRPCPLAWSPAGRLLAFSLGGGVAVADVVRGQIIGMYSGHRGGICSLAWSPDGQYIASVGAPPREVRVWKPDDWLG